MGRANNPTCVQCGNAVDTVEHTLLDCAYWDPFRSELVDRVGHSLSMATLSGILCGPAEEDLPQDPVLRGEATNDATESLRLFYRFVERLMAAKEEEERARQSAPVNGMQGRP